MGIKICPECKKEVAESRLLCPYCGYSFPSMKVCPDCGENCPIEATACPTCGHLFGETSQEEKGTGQTKKAYKKAEPAESDSAAEAKIRELIEEELKTRLASLKDEVVDAVLEKLHEKDASAKPLKKASNPESPYGLLVYDRDSRTVTYGLYPQTRIPDGDIISELELITPSENGWYLFNNEYYAKIEANPFDGCVKFDDGSEIVKGRTYWFKCEPIEWRVLSVIGDVCLAVSKLLLDARPFDTRWKAKDSNCSYVNSEIREWLNHGFLNSVFPWDDPYIQITKADYFAETLGTGFSVCAHEDMDIKDKIFLLNYADYVNCKYFDGDASRRCKTTDWARANGAYCSQDGTYCGWYWTNSTRSGSSGGVFEVRPNGSGDVCGYAFSMFGSVRPAIRIKIATKADNQELHYRFASKKN